MRLGRELNVGPVKAYEFGDLSKQPIALYVHGGPGSHCHYFAEALQSLPGLDDGHFAWLTYDQRGCGGSPTHHELTHLGNIQDLTGLLRWANQEYAGRLVGAVGHSYGAWLLYDTLTDPAYDGPNLPAVFIGLNPDRGVPRQKNFYLELLLAKLSAPTEYTAFLETQSGEFTEDLWRAKDELRKIPFSRDLRGFFYWANLDQKKWYETVKERCRYKECDDIFIKVRDSIYERPVKAFDFDLLAPGSTLLLGYQDFLMGGEHIETRLPLVRFFKSGHYPQYEQPEDFLALLHRQFGDRLA